MNAVLEQSRAIEKEHKLTEPTEGGGFVKEVPRAGNSLLRLQSYIELGVIQPKNKTWKPRVEALFTFELLHPEHMIKPADKPAFPMTLTFRVAKSLTKTSAYTRLFNAMNWDKTHEHFDTMIGDVAFFGQIHHNDKDPKNIYVNLNNAEGVWTIGKPEFTDPISGTVTAIPVPEMNNEGKLFLWEEAGWSDELIKLAWDTLFIETPEGSDKSRNWIQNQITTALDWHGSRTQAATDPAGNINVEGMDDSTPPADNVAKPENDDAALAALGL